MTEERWEARGGNYHTNELDGKKWTESQKQRRSEVQGDKVVKSRAVEMGMGMAVWTIWLI